MAPTDPGGPPVVRLEQWQGPWPADDKDANFKADVAAYTMLDPLETLDGLSDSTGIPVGALARYVLARWASAGNEALLQADPSIVERMWEYCDEAEAAGTDAARLDAYSRLREMVSWLRSGVA